MRRFNNPVIITGVYGAGKTEFCVNYAIRLRNELNAPVKLADLDVLNPYFRSREKADMLAGQGVTVIGNLTGNTGNQDIPAVSGDVARSVLAGDALVIDLAGSAQGLNALTFFKRYLKQYELWVVLNAFREESSTAEKVCEFIKTVGEASGLFVTGLVNNSHMLRETEAAHVLHGQDMALEASRRCGVPLIYTALQRNLYDKIYAKLRSPAIVFERLIMREDWQ